MKKISLLPPALFLFCLFLFSQPVFSQTANPAGTLERLSGDDIWAKTLTGSHYNEFWTYHFFFDNGMKVHITFLVANFGSLKSPVSGVQVSVDRLGGELYQLSREYDINHLVQDRKNHVFRLRQEREIYFEGRLPENQRIRIRTTKDDTSYDIELNIRNIVEGFKWGDGKYRIGDEEVGVFTHIPYAEASGHVQVNNVRESVRGTVYMDHTFQNKTTSQLLHSGYRFISHEDADNWDILFFFLPENSGERRTIGYRMVSRDGKVEVQGVNRIREYATRELFGETVARMLYVDLDNDTSVRLTRRKDTEKFSILSELGGFARRAARTFLGGEVVHFRGEAVLLEPGYRSKRGSYNFFIVH